MRTRTIALLLAAGSLLSCGWGQGRVPKDVTIGGESVGGLSYTEAEERVRARIRRETEPLVIHAPEGDLTLFDELSPTDDISRLVRTAKRGATVGVSRSRTLADAESLLLGLCERNARPAKNAAVSFSAEGFVYTPEIFGRACNYSKLLLDVLGALERGEREVVLPTRAYAPEVTERDLRAATRPLSEFSTRFDAGNAPRAHNIALAASRVSGTVLGAGESFSFNRTVGKRTEENGFRVAAVILDGEFVPGVGGGVCQASTTLFGAALRAGMEIEESHAHSLSVGYVPPSLDAMVSEGSDLRFFNPYDFPVYLLGSAKGGEVRFSFFGMPDGKRYETESVVLGVISPPPPLIVEGEEDRILRAEKKGIVSESYRLTYASDGRLISRKRIRKDRYAAVRGKETRAPAGETEEDLPPKEEKKGASPENREEIGRLPPKIG